MGARPIGDESFEVADRHRLGLLAADALHLALGFLRAYPAGDGGQGIVAKQAAGRAGQVTLHDEIEKARDVHHHRAALHAFRFLALDAALGF